MSFLRPPLPFLIPRVCSRVVVRRFHTSPLSSSTAEIDPSPSRTPNPPLELDPALQALLKDTDFSILRAKNRQRASDALAVDEESSLYRRLPQELEVLEAELESSVSDEVEQHASEHHVDDPFPHSERKSPAASFGSQGIGAVVLPFELQRSILRLISESDKPLIHADATRLFRDENDSEEAWSTRYTPPAYTAPRSTSKMSHIKARLNRHRDGTAFATVVMPAQYAVVKAVLEGVKTRLGSDWAQGVDRVVEWGSGTGAGMWATLHTFRQHDDESDNVSLASTSIVAYAGIDKREGLTSIARRLLRDAAPKSTSISIQKSLHPSDRVPRIQGLGTIALSAFNLSTLSNAGLRRQMTREMWDSGADIIVIIDDASAEGFRHVADAREHLLKLGRREVDAVARDKAQTLDPDLGDDPTSPNVTYDGRGKRGAHVVAPCPHDRVCPLAFHHLASSSSSKSPQAQASASSVRCTFSQRLQRPAFVRKTKHAGKGEEDVGYAYVVVRRGERPVVEAAELGRVGAVGRWEDEAVRAKVAELESEVVRRARWEGEGSKVEEITGVAVAEDQDEPLEAELTGEALEDVLRAESYGWPRLNFPPLKRSGHVLIDACMPEGNIMRLTFPRSQGKQVYYDARKSSWGDIFPHTPKHRPIPRYTGPKAKAAPTIPVVEKEQEDLEDLKTEKQFIRVVGLGEEGKRGKEKGRGKGRGGEGELKKVGIKTEGRAGWAGVMDGLKEEDRRRRRERRRERGAKELDGASV